MKKNLRARVAAPALSLVALACVGAWGQQATTDTFIDPIVVTATRDAQPLSEVLSSVTVITREEIERSQAVAIEDLLMGQPGIEFARNGGIGSTTSFFMRGQDPNSLAIYVDGVRVQANGYGSLQTSGLPAPQLVDRIEILRGNAGSLYGEAATGGVIDIHTKAESNSSPKAFSTVTIGSYSTTDVTAGYGGRINDTKFNLSVAEMSTAGFAPNNASQAPAINNSYWGAPYAASSSAGGAQAHSFGASISKQLDSSTELGLREFNSYQNFQWDDGTGPANYSLNRTNKNDLTVFVNYRLTSDWKTHLEVTNSSFNFINSEIYDSVAVQQGATVGSSPYSNTQASQNIFKWTNVYKLMNKNTLNFGYEYSTQNLVSSGQMNRNTSAFYAGYLQKIGSLDFQLNGRHDQVAVGGSDFLTNSQYYSVNTGLLGLGYWLTDSFRLTATESSGFSAPAIQQLAWNQSYANWNLLPQNVKSSEVGAEYVGSVGSFRGVRFNSTTTNYIDFQTTTGCTSTYGCYVNDPLVYNQGWEFTGRINYQGYKIVAAYTSQNPIDATTGEQQARRAKQFGSMDVDKAFGDNQRYDAGVKWVFSGSRLDNYCVNNSTCTLSAYQLWSFYAGMKLNDEFKVRFRIDNAFNENYQLAYGYNTPGTTAWLTLIYQEK